MKLRLRLLIALSAVLAIVIITAFSFDAAIGDIGAAIPKTAQAASLSSLFERIPFITPDTMPVPAPEPPEPEPPKTVKMTVVGDLMVHEWQFDDAYDKKTDTYDFNYSFDAVKAYLSDADYTIGNLETTFTGKEAGYAWFPLFNAPDEFADALKNAGFDFVTTANNHSNDKRKKGILRTLDVLDSFGIEHTGTFRSYEERGEVFIKEINGIRFAILSYSYSTNGIPLSDPYLLNIIDDELIVADIKRAKMHSPDFIIVLPHMGNEYETYPRDVFKNRIKAMLNAGADIVLASHPHVIQPAEYLDIPQADGSQKRCFAAYSLGNFISSQRTIPRDAGVIFNLYFEKEEGKEPVIKSVSYIPTWVKFVNSKGQYDIRVLSVYDTLTAHSKGIDQGVRNQDISRLKQVHKEISKTLQGREIPIEEIQNEYEIYTH